MNKQLLDLYSDYLLSSFGATTATGLSQLMGGQVSHDQVSRLLNSERLDAKGWWQLVKPQVRLMQSERGVLSFDDSILEKPYTDENELVCWHYDHAKGRTVKGINFLTALYTVDELSLPVNFRLVEKTEQYVDEKGKPKRRSPTTKNEMMREMLAQCVQNQIPFRHVLTDLWFASADNMNYIKLDLDKEFIMALKSNRKVALCAQDKQHGRYQRLDSLTLPEARPIEIYLEQVPFALHLLRQVFTNGDGSTGVRYLVTSDLTLSADQLASLYQKRWKVEEYHRSLKQNVSLTKSPTRTPTTQTNHFVAALWAFTKLELLKKRTKQNHYALKTHLYLSALQHAFNTLRSLHPIHLDPAAA